MSLKICANFGCGKPAYKTVIIRHGTPQVRCKECYERRLAARKRELTRKPLPAISA